MMPAPLLAPSRACLACAVQGVDEIVDRQTHDLLIGRQLALGMTTVLISAQGDHKAHAPEVLEMPGALAILVDADGSTRHLVGRASKRDSARSGLSGQSEASDNDHCEHYDSHGGGSDCNHDSDSRRDSASSLSRKKRSVAGQAGKVIKDGFKGIGKAGRMLGRTVAKAPGLSLLPSAGAASAPPAAQ